MDQILRSEVLLCCPAQPDTNPGSFDLDAPEKEPDNVYDEMYKGKGCGYRNDSVKENRTAWAELIDEGPLTEEEMDKIVKGRKTKVGEYPYVVSAKKWKKLVQIYVNIYINVGGII